MKRQSTWYFGGLLAVYVAGVALFWPDSGEQDGTGWALVVMFAPTAGAVLAKVFGGGQHPLGPPDLVDLRRAAADRVRAGRL